MPRSKGSRLAKAARRRQSSTFADVVPQGGRFAQKPEQINTRIARTAKKQEHSIGNSQKTLRRASMNWNGGSSKRIRTSLGGKAAAGTTDTSMYEQSGWFIPYCLHPFPLILIECIYVCRLSSYGLSFRYITCLIRPFVGINPLTLRCNSNMPHSKESHLCFCRYVCAHTAAAKW